MEAVIARAVRAIKGLKETFATTGEQLVELEAMMVEFGELLANVVSEGVRLRSLNLGGKLIVSPRQKPTIWLRMQ